MSLAIAASPALVGSYPDFSSGGAGGKFIPEVWSGKLQVKFYAATVLGEITNNDWEGEIKDQGDKVYIRSVPTVTVRNYEKGQSLTNEVPTSTPLELLIDKGKYFSVVLDDVDAIQSDIKQMDLFSQDAAEQVKIATDTDVLAGIVGAAAAANRGATAGAITAGINLGTTATPVSITKTNILDLIVDAGLVLDEQNVPESGRWMVIPAWAAAHLKKSDLKDASITGDGASVLRNGRVGQIDRFTLYVSNLLPVASGKFTMYAGTRDALTFASQITKVETLRAQSTFGDIMRGLNVFGYKVVKPEALVQIVGTRG
jgi:hypothetical protein